MKTFQEIADFAIEIVNNNSQEEILKALIRGVQYAYGMDVKGDIAEFGTMTGRTAVAIAVAHKMQAAKYQNDIRGGKKVWYLDSFEGLPEATQAPDLNSPHVQTNIWGTGTCKGLTDEEFSKLISQILKPGDFEVIKGWYSDTTKMLANSKFSMIHVDCDLYSSTMDALEPLFSGKNISPGAIIFFDDWNCNFASNDYGERKAWEELTSKFKVEFSDEGGYGVVSRKFIVHSYAGVE